MAFVDKIIGPDEKLIGVSTIHWMYGAIGIMWMVLFITLGLYINSYAIALHFTHPRNPGLIATNLMSNTVLITCSILGVTLFLLYLTMMICTEVALTTKRIIYKRGLIFVKVNEADLEEIKAAGVNNGWFGRILNYGYVELDNRFINNMNFPAIADPYRFVKAVNEVRGNLKSDSMTVVIDGHGKPEVAKADAGEDDTPKKKKKKKAKKKEEKLHKLDDPRYEALSNDPAKETQDMIADAQQGIANHEQYVVNNTMAPHPTTPPPQPQPEIPDQRPAETPAPQQPLPIPEQAPPQQPNPTPEVPTPPNPTPEQAPPPQGAAVQPPAQAKAQPASQPIIFEKENLREELKERLIEDFSELSGEEGRA